MKRSLAHFAGAMRGALVGEDADFVGVSTDSRTLARGELFVALSGPNFDAHDFVAAAAARGACGAVVARRLPLALPQIVVDDTLLALQRAAAAWREQFPIPVVAVAGSNGKTTTKELIAAILGEHGPCHATRGNLNNHIGVPLTLLGLERQHATAVVEIGANHAGDVAALMPLVRPTVGVVTNAGAEHLEGFGDLDGVARAEGELFAGLGAGATAIINADDAYAALWLGLNRAARHLRFGFAAAADFRAASPQTIDGGAGQQFTLLTPAGEVSVRLALAGRHNVVNALGAAAAAHASGATLSAIAAGLGRMRAVGGRLQLQPALRGAQLIDDSYNANPSSLTAALQVLAAIGGERWLVLGDMAELGAHTRAAHIAAGREARAAGVSRLFALGALTGDAVEAFGAGAEWFPDAAPLAARVVALLAPAVTVLVKGSRLNRLERVVAALSVPAAGPGPSRAADAH
jgi:UDP-N-acetylmuramoyl-tripeptide--D-alanyl-D-alanine ligase